jgi:hypothetical protein
MIEFIFKLNQFLESHFPTAAMVGLELGCGHIYENSYLWDFL